jgi:hypothetical protein
MDDQRLEDLYGPAEPYSDHKRGRRITFENEGQIWTGMILWVCEAGKVAERLMPVRYIVEADQRRGAPCVVWPSDVIEVR